MGKPVTNVPCARYKSENRNFSPFGWSICFLDARARDNGDKLKGPDMTDYDDGQDQAEKIRQFFSVAQQFNDDFFNLMIKQIETFDCSDEERVIFTTFVARSNLATAADFLLEMEDNPHLVGEIAASRVNARNQRKKAEKMRLLN